MISRHALGSLTSEMNSRFSSVGLVRRKVVVTILRGSVSSNSFASFGPNINLKLESILPCNLDKEYPLKYFYDFTEIKAQKQFKMLDANYDDWENFTKRDKKKDLSKCQKCLFNSVCNGIWHEYTDLHGFKEITPITVIKDKNILKF